MNTLPTGTVTFLFTDIEGSTKLAQQYPDAMPALLARHHEILNHAIAAHSGHVFQIRGDAFCAAFATAPDALNAALEAQRALHRDVWSPAPLKVRMGINSGIAQTGEGSAVAGGYTGYSTLARVQRVMSTAYGEQILLSNASAELLRGELPAGITLRDMGEHRLKGILNPERLWQVLVPDLPQDFPPLQTLNAIPNNLPIQLTSFVGREKDIAELKHLLTTTRLLTLTGSGGTGKTRLSLQVAAEVIDDFAQGTWFVELAALTDPARIPQTVASVLGLREEQGRPPIAMLEDYLRAKTALIILDNCEHLIDGCAQFADTILHTAPKVKILTSSREALNIGGEVTYRVPSLAVPDPQHVPSVEALTQYDAVRLFIDRAKTVMPSFEANNANAPAVAQICYHLDGIPLAIELAAARARGMKVEQIAQHLDDRFRLLTGGSRLELPRHQTLRALIDWSHSLLSEQERILFRRLSVFAGGWTIEAAETVCTGDGIESPQVLDLLLHLVDKSLIYIDEQSDETRYYLLETVRQYAREKLLETGEGKKVRTQHLAYFLKFAEEAEPHLVRNEQLDWFEHLEQDHDNLRAALEWATEYEQDAPLEASLRLVSALKFFWQMQGHWVEGKEWATRVLAKDEQANHTIALARVLVSAVMFEDDFRKSIKFCDESLAIGRELGDKLSIAESLLLKGIEVRNHVDNLAGRALLEESLEWFRELNDKRGMARAIYNIGNTEHEFPEVRRFYEESLRLSREIGDRRFIAIALMSLGGLAMVQGDWSAARTFFEESLSLGRELGDKHGLTMYLGNLGMLELGQGEYQQAQKLIEEGLTIARELGSKLAIANALNQMGILARYRGDFEQAIKLQTEGLAYCQDIDFRSSIPEFLYRVGELTRLQGDLATTHSFITDALKIAKESDKRDSIAYSLEEFAALDASQGQAKRAIILFGAAEALREAFHIVLLPVEKVEVEKNIAAARAQLDEATFNAAWMEGRAMTMEQAIEYALEQTNN